MRELFGRGCAGQWLAAGAGALFVACVGADPHPAPPWVSDPASHVDTLVGTAGGGNTFPGADVPFGMIQWSPDTSPHRRTGGGYDFTDSQLIGFSLTHLSGAGCDALGDVPILPMVGGLPSGDPEAHLEPLSHAGEVGTAGYYRVQSGSAPDTVATEITATQHSAMARFTFPATANANVLLKLLASANGGSASRVAIPGPNEVRGAVTVPKNFCGAASPYTVYFDVVFDRAFSHSQILEQPDSGLTNVVFLTFDATENRVVQAKAAVSWVSEANARANWNAENPRWDFDAVKSDAHAAWNRLLSRVHVAGGSADEQALFYTALYHALLHPNVFSDANGQYLGFDGKTHALSGTQRAQYANYSGWDIYRAQVQLSALVAPQEMGDAAQSILNDAAQNPKRGQLVKWALGNAETYVMVGDPSDGILAGYYAFGAKGFDTATALEDMLAEANTPNDMRPGLGEYESRGYMPDDLAYGCCAFGGSVATLLEYTKADFALSQFARALGDTKDADALLARAQNWQNVFDPATGLFTPRLANGAFAAGIHATSTRGMIEGTAAQYRFEEPFNRQSLLTAMGGPAAVNPILRSYMSALDTCGDDPTACFTNEMDLGQQYWGDATGEPYATQDVVNRLRTRVFAQRPAFMNNNDDLGAESAMLVWSMLGIYPDYPGSAILTVNSPEFPEALVDLPGGRAIAIGAPGASTRAPYVQSLRVNGQVSSAPWLDASFVHKGGTLDFTMAARPNVSWGASPADAPPSYGARSTAAIGFATNPIVVAPGSRAQASFGVVSTRSDIAQTIEWQLGSRGSGAVGIFPTSGSLPVAAGGRATQPLTLTAPATEGTYFVPVQIRSTAGIACPPLTLVIAVARPPSH